MSSYGLVGSEISSYGENGGFKDQVQVWSDVFWVQGGFFFSLGWSVIIGNKWGT